MSQPVESLPAGPLPERDDLKKNIWKIVDDIGPQNLSVKMLRKRLESIYKIEFTSHKVALEELILEKLKEEPTQIQLAKAAKAQEEGLVSAGKGKKKGTRGSGLAKKTPKKEGKSESKRAKKEKKPDNYPKAAQTAYFIFSGVKRSEIPAGTSVTETAKLIGEAWKNLSDDEKESYKAKAEEDKARFQRDMDAYIAGGGEVIGRATKKGSKKAAKKENNGPKRAMSGYFFFTQAKRAEVQAKNPELKMTEVAKALGNLWKELSDEEKKPFEEQAAADKERYVKECAAIGKVVKPSTGAKRKRKVVSDSDSSDSSDSDGSDSSDSDSSDSSDSDSSDSSSSDSDSD